MPSASHSSLQKGELCSFTPNSFNLIGLDVWFLHLEESNKVASVPEVF